MNKMKWIDKNFECLILSIFLALMVVFMMLQVFGRKLFGASFPWVEPFCCKLMIWTGLLGVSCTMREGNAIRFDVITSFVSEKKKKIFDVVSDIIVAIVFIYLTPFTFMVVPGMADKTIPGLPFNMNIVYMICAICVVCIDIRAVQGTINSIKWLVDDKKGLHAIKEEENK